MTLGKTHDGWKRLSNGYDVRFVHGIPTRLSDNGLGIETDPAKISNEILALSGLNAHIDDWHDGEDPGEREAALSVDAQQFGDVLERLALASAALYVDRFHHAIDANAVDWDDAEYARDFNRALEHCGMGTGVLNRNEYFDMYKHAMHREARRLIEDDVSPEVEAE